MCKKYHHISWLFFLLWLILPLNAYAITPTSSEFHLWDERCKALYVSTSVGSRSEFADTFPSSLAHKYRAAANNSPNVQGGPWHYCDSLIHLNRAKTSIDKKEARRHYTLALDEAKYTFRRISKKDPWVTEMAVTLGRIEKGLGRNQKAEKYYKQAIKLNPQSGLAYSELALLYRHTKKMELATSTLIEATKILKYDSAEIYYFLGIFSLETNSFDKAKAYSVEAYRLGYPLPYLKKQIEKIESSNLNKSTKKQ